MISPKTITSRTKLFSRNRTLDVHGKLQILDERKNEPFAELGLQGIPSFRFKSSWKSSPGLNITISGFLTTLKVLESVGTLLVSQVRNFGKGASVSNGQRTSTVWSAENASFSKDASGMAYYMAQNEVKDPRRNGQRCFPVREFQWSKHQQCRN